MLNSEQIDEIENLVVQYDLRNAAERLLSYLQDPAKRTAVEYYLQKIKTLETENDKGVISREQVAIEFNKLATGILQIILPAASVPQKADRSTYYNLGNNLFRQEKFVEAIQYFTKAVLADAGYAEAYLERGAAKVRLGLLDAGIIDLSTSLLLSPNQPFAYFNRGIAHFQNNDLEKACEDWQRVKAMGFDIANSYLEQFCP